MLYNKPEVYGGAKGVNTSIPFPTTLSTWGFEPLVTSLWTLYGNHCITNMSRPYSTYLRAMLMGKMLANDMLQQHRG